MKQTIGLMVAVAVAAGGALVQAQDAPSAMPALAVHAAPAGAQQSANAAPSPDTSTCTYVFTNPGAQNTFLRYCVTVNGNIMSFNSPNGDDQIIQGTIGEGYGICDFATGIRYFDWSDFGGDSGNWNSPVLVALTAGMVKIARTTSDGAWTLTQTISKIGGPSPSAKVTMALKNNSGARKQAYLLRYADVDPADANSTGNFAQSFDSNVFSAWGYSNLVSGQPAVGLKITELGSPAPATATFGWEGIDQVVASGPDPCNPAGNYGALQPAVDGSIIMLWGVQLNPHQTGTFVSKYEMF
jgi:hypothetical protein